VNGMPLAKSTILLQLDSVRIIPFVLVRGVIPLLALGTRQDNQFPHGSHSRS